LLLPSYSFFLFLLSSFFPYLFFTLSHWRERERLGRRGRGEERERGRGYSIGERRREKLSVI
jgi:hypothetical protein